MYPRLNLPSIRIPLPSCNVANLLVVTERNGRKTLTTVQGLPKKFDQKKILKVIKKKFGRFHRVINP